VKGVVDYDDIKMNVYSENMKKKKIIKVIKKKMVRKEIEMFKKMEKEDYEKLWKEY
jgi:heat shock protein beta